MVYAGMGYIIGLALLIVAVPLLFILLSRRTTSGGRLAARDHGVTVSKPSSDQPTPRADGINQAAPGTERRLPPG